MHIIKQNGERFSSFNCLKKGLIFLFIVFSFLLTLYPAIDSIKAATAETVFSKKSVKTIGASTYSEWLTTREVSETPDTVTVEWGYWLGHRGDKNHGQYQMDPVEVVIDGVVRHTFDYRNAGKVVNADKKMGTFKIELSRGTKHHVIMRDKYNNGIIPMPTVEGDYYFPYPTYKVNFVNGYGGTISSQDVTRYQDAKVPANPTRYGYTFAGWDGNYKRVTENRTITALWNINKYSVTFKDYDGTILKSETVNHGGNAVPPANPSRPGYIFTGWDKGYTNIQGNTTITAQYKINQYTAYFDGNGGSVNPSSITKNYGEALGTLPTANRNGYTFQGWYTAVNGGDKISANTTMPINGATYYAHWTPNQYMINYELNGGKNHPDNPTTFTTESKDIIIKAPSKEGFTFTGWTGSNGNTPQKNVTIPHGSTGNKSYTANWNKNPIIVGKDFKVIEGDNFPTSNLITGKGYITQGTSEFPNKLVEVTYPMTASDAEDGTITNRIKVTKVVGPNGETLSNVDTSKIGTYTIHYNVTDNAGTIITTTRKITVLPASTAVIQAEDRYFYRGSKITQDILIDKIKATDKYDGNITSKVIIPDFDNINPDFTGDYEITYKVTNRSHKTTTKKVIIHVIDTMEDINTPYRIRFISNDYLGTIDANSKWKTNQKLYNELIESLNSNTKEKSKKIYKFSNDEIKNIQKDIKNNGFKRK